MDSQIARPPGHHYEQEPHYVGMHSVVEGDQDEHHQEKKSVLKKVKAKAKKMKDTLKLHGHDHDERYEGHLPDDRDLDEEDDDGDEEMVEDPEILGSSGNSQASSPAPRDDGEGQLKFNVGRSGGIKEAPQTPANTPASVTSAIDGKPKDTAPVRAFVRDQETSRGQPELNLDRPIELEEDPHAPKERFGDSTPSNYQSKVIDPTGAGGQDVEISSVLRSFDKMDIGQVTKPGANETSEDQNLSSILPTGSHDQFSSELSSPEPITTEVNLEPIQGTLDSSKPQVDTTSEKTSSGSNQSRSYTEKISSATSVIADKATAAKNVVASKLGYGGEEDSSKGREMRVGLQYAASKPVEYGKKIPATVTEKLSPVYQKVALSKVRGTGTGTGNEVDGKVGGHDNGVSVKDYVVEKLKPGEEDKALSEVITEALYKRRGGEPEKSINNKAMGKATDSGDAKRRSGSGTTTEESYEEGADGSNIPGKGVVDKLKGVVGSWLGKGEDQPWPSQQPLGSTTGSEGLSTTSSGESTGERRLQESGN